MQSILSNNLSIFLLFIFLNIFFIYISSVKKFKQYQESYDGLQKIHDGYVPRIAGAILFLFLFIININNYFYFSKYLLVIQYASIPLITISFLEDSVKEIKPLVRSFFIFLSASLLIVFILKDLPTIELPILSYLINNFLFIKFIFFIFAIYILCNSINLIDGVNGLAFFNCISILLSLILLSIKTDDVFFQTIFQFLLLCYLIQLFFNFPKSFFFMGDLGAYFGGFILSALIVDFFAKNNSLINSWVAVLIIFYPIFELLFSTLRRLYLKKGLTSPDKNHLHHLVYSFLNDRLKNKFANSLTSIILLPLWSFPFFWIHYTDVLSSIMLCFVGIALQVFLYVTSYIFFRKLNRCKI